jgi:hypothetical protein
MSEPDHHAAIAKTRRRWHQFSLRSLLLFTFAIALLAGVIKWAWQANNESVCRQHLELVYRGLAFHYEVHHRFPPLYTTDNNGRPMQSWRAYLIPYAWPDHDPHIYRQYKCKEPWDSPTNKKFWMKYGDYFCHGYVESDNVTNYVAPAGGSCWPNKGVGVLPGSGKALLLVELVDSDIVWAKPEDIALSEISSLLNSDASGDQFSRRVRHVLAVDAAGASYILDPARDIEEIRAIVKAEEQSAAKQGRLRGTDDGGKRR